MKGGGCAVTRVLGPALAVMLAAAPASAQGLIDWRPRTQLRPDVLATGAAAAFWNPAASRPPGRGELIAVDLDVPTGLRGIAAAGALALTSRITIAAGYENLRLEEIDRTSTSPLPDPGGNGLDVSEHVFTSGAAWAVHPSFTAGLAARYVRRAALLGGGGGAGVTAGGVYAPASRFAPRFGGTLDADADGLNWAAGAEFSPLAVAGGAALTLGYGLDASPATGMAQRVAAGVLWREFAGFTAALLGEPESGGTSWHPAAEASVQLRRYGLGFAHERLPNGFGGVNTFRLSIRF
jgi:hypothetical protein